MPLLRMGWDPPNQQSPEGWWARLRGPSGEARALAFGALGLPVRVQPPRPPCGPTGSPGYRPAPRQRPPESPPRSRAARVGSRLWDQGKRGSNPKFEGGCHAATAAPKGKVTVVIRYETA